MNNKTKTILFSFLVSVILLYGMDYANAINENASDKAKKIMEDKMEKYKHMITNEKSPSQSQMIPETESEKHFKELTKQHGMPKIMPEQALNGLLNAIPHHKDVKDLLGNDYKYVNTAQYLTEDGWQPQITFDTDGGENRVTVTMDKGKVVSMDKYKTTKWSHNRSVAVIDYEDWSYNIRGLEMVGDVPDYTHQWGSSFTAVLVNLQSWYSEIEDVCDADNTSQSYWAQVGIQFDDEGTKIGYTDTTMGCVPAFFESFSFQTGDKIKYMATMNNTTNDWTMMVDNLDDVDPPYAYITNIPYTYATDVFSVNTSVWFENPNTFLNDGWDAGFTNDPELDYVGFQWHNGLWYYWEEEHKLAINCDPGTTGSQLILGNPIWPNPTTITFDVSEIEDHCKAPWHP